MDLTGRLAAIAGLVPPDAVVADIGTDHARLPLYLVRSGRCPQAIATDLNEKPYQAACQAVAAAETPACPVEVRRGNGLAVLAPGEADVVVVAGMGGNTIRQILAAAPAVLAAVKRLILQPMVDAADLRRWLVENGWRLVDETLVAEDGHLYVVIVAEPGIEVTKDPLLLEIGPRLVDKGDPLLPAYLEKIKSDYQRILSGLARSRNPVAAQKAIRLTARLAKVREVAARCR